MTNKEAINILKDMIDYQWGFSDMEKSIGIDALEEAIEALENQSSVIEKLENIKAEIKQNQKLYYYNNKTDTYYDVIKTDTVLKVIDNYIEELKGEQE